MKIILSEVLKQKGKSMYWLSKETGITMANLSNICNGKTSSIKLEVLEKICVALECTPRELFEPDSPRIRRLMAYENAIKKHGLTN